MKIFSSGKDSSSPGAARVMERCDQLATISSMSGGICRTYLTDEHKRCNEVVSNWIDEAGMTSWVDEAGNCWGRYQANNDSAEIVVLGSHLDTVPNAGKYDGILGVLSAIEVIDQFHRDNVRFPFNIEIVGFADEEGTRFGATLLGSRAVAGTWNRHWFDLQDANGISLASAMESFGLHPEKVYDADRSAEKLLAYLELHIEQGPVLVKQDVPVGIVTSIAGARRFVLTFNGMAGHAGTVPMDHRRDAGVAAAIAIQQIEKVARRSSVLATVGKIKFSP